MKQLKTLIIIIGTLASNVSFGTSGGCKKAAIEERNEPLAIELATDQVILNAPFTTNCVFSDIVGCWGLIHITSKGYSAWHLAGADQRILLGESSREEIEAINGSEEFMKKAISELPETERKSIQKYSWPLSLFGANARMHAWKEHILKNPGVTYVFGKVLDHPVKELLNLPSKLQYNKIAPYSMVSLAFNAAKKTIEVSYEGSIVQKFDLKKIQKQMTKAMKRKKGKKKK